MQLYSQTPSVFFVLLGEKGVQSALKGITLPSNQETNTLWYKAYSMLLNLPIRQGLLMSEIKEIRDHAVFLKDKNISNQEEIEFFDSWVISNTVQIQ